MKSSFKIRRKKRKRETKNEFLVFSSPSSAYEIKIVDPIFFRIFSVTTCFPHSYVVSVIVSVMNFPYLTCIATYLYVYLNTVCCYLFTFFCLFHCRFIFFKKKEKEIQRFSNTMCFKCLETSD